MRELVGEFAQEHNLLFMPAQKTHEASGRLLYRLGGTPQGAGGVLIHLEDDIMFVQQNGEWVPVGFDEVLEIARR
jgi:tuftelin-interacting protein 11